MVKVEEIKNKDLRKAKDIIKALKILGIEQIDLLKLKAIDTLIDENSRLKQELEQVKTKMNIIIKTEQANMTNIAEKKQTLSDVLKEINEMVIEEYNPDVGYGQKKG